LQGVKKIAYSPSGKLYGIAFHALPVDSSTLLMDKYEMAQYTSTRQVALRKEKEGIAQPKSITLFGNADFTMDSLELTRLKKNSDYIAAVTTTTAIAQRAGGQGVWPDLPGTAEEISRINELFRTSKLTTQLYVRQDASEENLKNLTGNSTQTLHIATHGFFLKDRSGKKESTGANIYSIAQDPLLRSGLILSGGNYAWSGKRPIEGVEDGIVTAYEISQLNLSGTDVVVLSACETALGDIKGNEGVFGLQRAFKMGGVKKIIVSLWQVPDKETMELMTSFYNYWIRGKTIEVAFSLAQAEMRRRYAPFFWAAFVMIE
jgi:CHAT domain-containing protein